MNRTKVESAPVCRWCGIRTPVDSGYRGEDPTLPPGSGVVVCTPACPERPDGRKVYEHPRWRR